MILKTYKCPECGELAKGTVELLAGTALLDFYDLERGECDWNGETNVHWDSSTTQYAELKPGEPQIALTCGSHEWLSNYEE